MGNPFFPNGGSATGSSMPDRGGKKRRRRTTGQGKGSSSRFGGSDNASDSDESAFDVPLPTMEIEAEPFDEAEGGSANPSDGVRFTPSSSGEELPFHETPPTTLEMEALPADDDSTRSSSPWEEKDRGGSARRPVSSDPALFSEDDLSELSLDTGLPIEHPNPRPLPPPPETVDAPDAIAFDLTTASSPRRLSEEESKAKAGASNRPSSIPAKGMSPPGASSYEEDAPTLSRGPESDSQGAFERAIRAARASSSMRSASLSSTVAALDGEWPDPDVLAPAPRLRSQVSSEDPTMNEYRDDEPTLERDTWASLPEDLDLLVASDPKTALKKAQKLFNEGEHSLSLRLAQVLSSKLKRDPSLVTLIQNNTEILVNAQMSRMGGPKTVPRPLIQSARMSQIQLDHRSAFLLSRIDGLSTLEEVLDISGMGPMETLKVLSYLAEMKLIEL